MRIKKKVSQKNQNLKDSKDKLNSNKKRKRDNNNNNNNSSSENINNNTSNNKNNNNIIAIDLTTTNKLEEKKSNNNNLFFSTKFFSNFFKHTNNNNNNNKKQPTVEDIKVFKLKKQKQVVIEIHNNISALNNKTTVTLKTSNNSLSSSTTSSNSSSSSDNFIISNTPPQSLTTSPTEDSYTTFVQKDLKIDDYYNLTTTQVPNSQFLHRLDSRMVGILSESDVKKCQDIIPKDQTFLQGFSLLLLTHSTTMIPSSGTPPSNGILQNITNNNSNSAGKKIRTYSTSPVALLLTDKSAFIVLYDTRSQSIQQIETCDLIEIRDIQTGYIHTPSSVDSDESVFISSNKKSGQFSMRILKIYGGSWTLMPYSPADSPETLRDRVQMIAITVRSLIQNSKLSHTIEAKLDNSEKFHIPVAYFQPKPEQIVEGDIYFNLKKFSFIQSKNEMKFKNIINYKREDFSFSIELLSIYECTQTISTIIDGYSQLTLQSQGSSSNQSYILYLPKSEIEQITKNIIRLVTESQDIVDQIVLDEDSNHLIKDESSSPKQDEIYDDQDLTSIDDDDSSTFSKPSTTKQLNQNISNRNNNNNNNNNDILKDSDFYILDDELEEEENNIILKNIFSGDSNLLSNEDQLWLQKYLPFRYTHDEFELVYSTNKHGISIRTFFSNLAGRSPCILVIKDDKHQVFGAYTSDPWNPDSTIHYGGGETFLFKLSPERKRFAWTRENEFFMLSKNNFLSLGSGKSGAGFGLWIDEDLLYGSSTKCETFNNDILSYSTDFKILEIEVWSSVFSKNNQPKKQQNATDFFGTTFTYKPPPGSVYSYRSASGY